MELRSLSQCINTYQQTNYCTHVI